MISFGFESAYGESLNSYRIALEHSPRNPSIYLQKANLELLVGDTEKAQDYTRYALSIKFNYTDAFFFLANIEFESGRNAWYFYGVTRYEVGANEDAEFIFSALSEKYSENKELKTILSNINNRTEVFSGINSSFNDEPFISNEDILLEFDAEE